MNTDFDLIVIGAGPGGYTAALHAARSGLKTAVCDFAEAGGTCLNRGCVPTKTLLHSSQLLREALNGAPVGVRCENVTPDLDAMFARKRQISNQLSEGIESLFRNAKVTFLKGRAVITEPGKVCVTSKNGDPAVYTAENVLVATGSVPAMPPIAGLRQPGVLTSDEILEGTSELYESIVIIGGGVIGAEFATFYSDLGTQVSVVEAMDRMLPNMDKDLGQGLQLALKKQGVQVYTGAFVKEVIREGEELAVRFETSKGMGEARGQVVLCAIGRSPYMEGVFGEGLEPEKNGKGLYTDERFRTSIPGVYAIGDVTSRIQLAHVATAQGTACVDMICGKPSSVDLSLVPACIYSRPEIASVGMTQDEAKKAGIETAAGKCVMGANARTMIEDPGRSFMKILARTDDHRIIGASLMCSRASDMISEAAEAIAAGLTAEQMLAYMRPHPTFEEAMGEALEDLAAKLKKADLKAAGQ